MGIINTYASLVYFGHMTILEVPDVYRDRVQVAVYEYIPPIVSITDATTTTKGIVMLEDSVTSTSIAKAATPKSVKVAYDLANGKADKVAGKQLSTEDYTSADKTKMAGIAPGANNYIHPANHPASIITQDATRRMVSDVQIADWNTKETTAGAQGKADKAEQNAKSAIPTKVSQLTQDVPLGKHTHTIAEIPELLEGTTSIKVDRIEAYDMATFNDDIMSNAGYFVGPLTGGVIAVIDRNGTLRYKGEDTDLRYASKLSTPTIAGVKSSIDAEMAKHNTQVLHFDGNYNGLSEKPDLSLFATVAQLNNKSEILLKGERSLAGTTGTIITHSIGHTDYYAMITPSQNPSGYMGEVWVEYSNTSFKVCCSGTAMTKFKYVVFS